MAFSGVLHALPARGRAWAAAAGGPVGRRRPEAPAFLLLATLQVALAWMLPRVPQPSYYLLASALVLCASGCLVTARPRFTGALVGTTGVAVAAALVTAAAPVPARAVIGVGASLATAALIAQVAHLRRYRLEVRGRATRLRLEGEQQHSRGLTVSLERLSPQDALTGLANRRQWDAALGRACEEARTTGGSVAVVLLDLDHFASINDRHGHPAGDEALRHVAMLLAAGVRGGDVVARLGGDELAALLPGATLDQAAARAEALRAGIELLVLPGFWAGEITASLGVAAAAGGQAFPMELMSRADQQLYRAKITRNQIGLPEGVPPVPAPRSPAASERLIG